MADIEDVILRLKNIDERLDRHILRIIDCENNISNLSGSMRVLNRRLEKVKAGEDR